MQRQLIGDYKEDVRKYAQGMNQTRILNVFNQIPSQLAKDNKKFQITKAAPGARFKDYWGCIEWFADSGLLVAMLDEEAQEDSTLEEDFFVRTAGELLPVEVKAKNGRAKSLRILIESSKYPDIRHGIKLIDGNVGFREGIFTFPYFCAFLLKRYLKTWK